MESSLTLIQVQRLRHLPCMNINCCKGEGSEEDLVREKKFSHTGVGANSAGNKVLQGEGEKVESWQSSGFKPRTLDLSCQCSDH